MCKEKRRQKIKNILTGACIASGIFMMYSTMLLSSSSDAVPAMEQVTSISGIKKVSIVNELAELYETLKIEQASSTESSAISSLTEGASSVDTEHTETEETSSQEDPLENEIAHADFFIEEIPLDYDLQAFAYEICQENNIQYEYFLALMWKESRFIPDSINVNTNGTTDTGLMQINDIHREFLAESLGITDLTDPKQNMQAGAYFISNLLGKYNEHDALYAYQYGENGMTRQIQLGVTTTSVIQNTLNKRDEIVELRQQ